MFKTKNTILVYHWVYPLFSFYFGIVRFLGWLSWDRSGTTNIRNVKFMWATALWRLFLGKWRLLFGPSRLISFGQKIVGWYSRLISFEEWLPTKTGGEIYFWDVCWGWVCSMAEIWLKCSDFHLFFAAISRSKNTHWCKVLPLESPSWWT